MFWAICLGDINPPPGIRAAMEMQAEAERKKRAQVLESEGTLPPIVAVVLFDHFKILFNFLCF